jgi:hypothetical protein
MPNKIKTNPETPVIFQPTGSPVATGAGFAGGNVVHFVADALPTGQGRISTEYDLGTGPRTTLFEWRGKAIPTSGASIGSTIAMYLSTSNSVAKDGALPVIEGSMNARDKVRNLPWANTLQVDTSGNPDPAISSGLVEIYGRYISLVWWNDTEQPLGTGNYFILTPVPDEIQ